MRVFSKQLASISCGLVLAMATATQAQNLAVVNGVPVPSSRADQLFQEYNARQPVPKEHHERLRSEIRNELINREVLAQEAKRQGLQTSKEYKELLDMARQTILVKMLFKKFQEENKPTDADIKAKYDSVLAEASGRKEYKTSHILIEAKKPEAFAAAKEKADKLLKELQDGADFAKMAKKHSADPGSAKQGGDLGWADSSTFVPEFSAAMQALKPGETTSEPVKSQFGYHIIRLTETRDLPKPDFPPLEQVKEQVADQLMQEKSAEFQKKLRDAATVK